MKAPTLKTRFLQGYFRKFVKGDDLANKMLFKGMYSMLGKYTRVIVWVLQDQGTGSRGMVTNYCVTLPPA